MPKNNFSEKWEFQCGAGGLGKDEQNVFARKYPNGIVSLKEIIPLWKYSDLDTTKKWQVETLDFTNEKDLKNHLNIHDVDSVCDLFSYTKSDEVNGYEEWKDLIESEFDDQDFTLR